MTQPASSTSGSAVTGQPAPGSNSAKNSIAAAMVRSMLGISPSAWLDARNAMGETEAAIVVAAILQRSEAISSAGGYLRGLTRKAEANEFSIGPMLMALIGSRRREPKRA